MTSYWNSHLVFLYTLELGETSDHGEISDSTSILNEVGDVREVFERQVPHVVRESSPRTL